MPRYEDWLEWKLEREAPCECAKCKKSEKHDRDERKERK